MFIQIQLLVIFCKSLNMFYPLRKFFEELGEITESFTILQKIIFLNIYSYLLILSLFMFIFYIIWY